MPEQWRGRRKRRFPSIEIPRFQPTSRIGLRLFYVQAAFIWTVLVLPPLSVTLFFLCRFGVYIGRKLEEYRL